MRDKPRTSSDPEPISPITASLTSHLHVSTESSSAPPSNPASTASNPTPIPVATKKILGFTITPRSSSDKLSSSPGKGSPGFSSGSGSGLFSSLRKGKKSSQTSLASLPPDSSGSGTIKPSPKEDTVSEFGTLVPGSKLVSEPDDDDTLSLISSPGITTNDNPFTGSQTLATSPPNLFGLPKSSSTPTLAGADAGGSGKTKILGSKKLGSTFTKFHSSTLSKSPPISSPLVPSDPDSTGSPTPTKPRRGSFSNLGGLIKKRPNDTSPDSKLAEGTVKKLPSPPRPDADDSTPSTPDLKGSGSSKSRPANPFNPSSITSLPPSPDALALAPLHPLSPVTPLPPVSLRSSLTPEFLELQRTAHARMEKLGTAGLVITGALSLAKAAPLVKDAVGIVQGMWGMVEKVGVCQVAAYRMIERSTNLVYAVQQSIIAVQGKGVSPEMEQNLIDLVRKLRNSSAIIYKLANRPFLKLYFNTDALEQQIRYASEDLKDCVDIFQVQASINTMVWQTQAEEDRRRDVERLIGMIKRFSGDGDEMYKIMDDKSVPEKDLTEVINTFQRSLNEYKEALQDDRRAKRLSEYTPTHTPRPKTPVAPGSPDERVLRFSVIDSVESPSAARSYQGSLVRTPEPVSSGGETDEEGPVGSPGARERWKRAGWKAVAVERFAKGVQVENAEAHIHFLEKGLDVLLRRSGGSNMEVPPWTIGKLDITHIKVIGTGTYATVWKGLWRGHLVAIKELKEFENPQLFVNEVEVWRRLKHDCILQFWGASSTTGLPPWFMISPFMEHRDVITYIRTPEGAEANRKLWLYQVAQGMEYLHSRDIIHGDLKSSNILISNNGNALVADFGLSELREDIARSSKEVFMTARTALRWTAPEILQGKHNTKNTDIFAFGITMIDILSGGELPYGTDNERDLRRDILDHDRRPSLAKVRRYRKLCVIMQKCWIRDPRARPPFSSLVPVLEDLVDDPEGSSNSRDSRGTSGSSATSGSYISAQSDVPELPPKDPQPQPHVAVALSPHMVLHSLPADDSTSSSSSDFDHHNLPNHVVSDLQSAAIRVSKGYRSNLEINWDDRFLLPLWEPSPVALGDVGYITRTQGFFRLFNAIEGPPISVRLPMRYLDEFEVLRIDTAPFAPRGVAERISENLSSALRRFTTSQGKTSSKQIVRKVPFPLRAHRGRRHAGMVLDNAEQTSFHDVSRAKEYMIKNIDALIEVYGHDHVLKKEDIIIVVGTIQTKDWALMTAVNDPNGTLEFNVHAYRKADEPWGTWSLERLDSDGSTSTSDMDEGLEHDISVKVAHPGNGKEAVLLARLKYPTKSSSEGPVLY